MAGAAPLPEKPRKRIDCDVAGLRLRMAESVFRQTYEPPPPEDHPEADARSYFLDYAEHPDVKGVKAFFHQGRLVRVETEFKGAFVQKTEWFGWASKYTRLYGPCVFTQDDAHPPYVTDVASWQDFRAHLELRHRWETDRRRNFKLNSRYWSFFTDNNCPPSLQEGSPK